MPPPATIDDFLNLVRKSGVTDPSRLDAHVQKLRASCALPDRPAALGQRLIRDGLLTIFQTEQLLHGKYKGFYIGKYRVLERLGTGGMANVFLCEHKDMRRRVAIKVLAGDNADNPAALERFHREARAAAVLDHPNIVRAFDSDQDGGLHFLVMEYVDGINLQRIVAKGGPLAILRAAHYISQVAVGLQHAHDKGLVHRDVKPSNILLDRGGTAKVLDMGLARFFNDLDDMLTRKYHQRVVGTADFLAPEQAIDSHRADVRADIYSLGATLYFCLAGRAPFEDEPLEQKLYSHIERPPPPLRHFRPEVPAELAAVVSKMMAKKPAQRYQTPAEVADALVAWTRKPIPPPPDEEMPRLCLAAQGNSADIYLPPVAGPAAPTGSKFRPVPAHAVTPPPVKAAQATAAAPAPATPPTRPRIREHKGSFHAALPPPKGPLRRFARRLWRLCMFWRH